MNDGDQHNVIALGLERPKVDPVVVERLEDLLARAKAGEIVAVAVGAVLTGGRMMTSWRSNEGGVTMFALMGGLSELQRQMGKASTERVD